jgi:hypothetical protein
LGIVAGYDSKAGKFAQLRLSKIIGGKRRWKH